MGGGALVLLGAPPDVLAARRRLRPARDAHFRHVVHCERLPVSGTHDWTARTRLVYANEAYKGYGLVSAGRELRVRYQAVHDARQPQSGVFTLRRFHVESGSPVVHDDGGPVPLPAPSPPGTLPPLPPVGGVGPIA